MLRTLIIFLVELAAVLISSALLPGFIVDSLGYAIIFAVILSLINAFLRPFLLRVTLPLTILSVGIFSLVLNAFLIVVTTELVSGVYINGIWNAIILSIVMAGINSLLNSIFAIDDLDSYYRNIIKKQKKNKEQTSIKTGEPGVIFLEIDGLSKSIFSRALRNGYMPTMAKWLKESHELTSWHTDLASSTPPSQAGILHGSNSDMPAFRWFDRRTQEVFSMSSPKNAMALESKFNKKAGLLQGGMSINNMFSGGSSRSVLTASTILKRGGLRKQDGLYYYFVNPYNFSRSFLLSLVDIVHELRDTFYQRRFGVEPRIDHRLGKYPIIRAVTTIVMRDIATNTIIGDMMTGLPAVYATYVAYDEVAHHAGIERSEAMHTLAQLDKQFAKIEQAISYAPRPYNLVVLSDHGQSQGATFKQRYGETLEELVNKSIGTDEKVFVSKDHGEEGSSRTRTVFMQIAGEGNNKVSKKVNEKATKQTETEKVSDDVVVLASGNLGLIYFTKSKSRQGLEQIKKEHPELLETLINHEGISFVAVDSKNGPVVLSKTGSINLKSNKVSGKNPLEIFSEHAQETLARQMSFKNGPDILVMSLYIPATEEVAAFEELVGSHGGLGGGQNEPLLFYPKEFKIPENEIVGAENLHNVLKTWVPKK